MTPAEAVRGVAGPIGRLGGEWMFDQANNERGVELGLSRRSWYHCGRGGVLGDCDAAVAVAAFGFFPPALQAKAWDRGRAVMPVATIAHEYAGACATWGRRVFADVPDAGRLAHLLTTALDAASIAGLPLFAGWRALAGAAGAKLDDAGRLALALQVGREHRGGLHLAAVVAAGVDPLQAVVSGRYGPANAAFFGWPKPWPDPAVGKDAMAAVEAVTDRLVEPAYAALAADDRAELVTGLRALVVPR